ncbi:RICIN domain-containing protein [Salmonella enterica]|nr:lipoprotein EnvE [Salmonella enterica]EAW2229556.1 lipoprotein EnvE [Salmonella enterica subsp. enterica]EEP3162192.1 ricin-type beta-trefoil lectin domain protein [Salmonella enterica subsp. houtenae serovar 43:z4,z32:-]EGJ3414038.1 ricin-type beta-trefoil lectin domain protein [Salmonella enterica subsp. houtenae]EBH3345005.1 lipoprotein EnvE [Salmonella enterica]
MALLSGKTALVLCLSSILCGCTADGLPAPYSINLSFPVITQNQINSGGYYINDAEPIRTTEGLCLDTGSGQQNHLTLQECKNVPSQLFSFHRDKITHREKCLDAAGQGTKEGTPIILYSCTGNDNQRWFTDDNKIKGKQSRKCLGTNSFFVRKGDPVVLADCDFSRALEFTIR